MRKLLTATTALALVGGAAFAEISVTGDATVAFGFDSGVEGHESKHSFQSEFGIDFAGTGTTDGGLSFGASVGFDADESNKAEVDEGQVYVSGAFGKLTIGDNDAADVLAGGIADVGAFGIGIDNVAEGQRGGSASTFRYDNSFGQISLAITAGTKAGSAKVPAVSGIWQITDTSDEIVQFSTARPDREHYDRLLAVSRTIPTSGDNKDIETATRFSEQNIFGLSRNKAGKVVQADGTTLVTDQLIIKAFDFYESHYDLGSDGKVGGTNAPQDESATPFDDTEVADVATPAVNRAQTDEVPAVNSDNQYALGMSFEASGVRVGIGYDSEKVISLGLGYSIENVSANAFYSTQSIDGDEKDDPDEKHSNMGLDLGYTMGASTLTLVYASHDVKNKDHVTNAVGGTDAYGIGLSHDLGGGAKLSAGFGTIKPEEGDSTNMASVGLSFTF